MKLRMVLAVAVLTIVSIVGQARVKVACVGNSITYGATLDDRETESYPSVLQRLLGDGYEVGNFGHSGATLLERGHNPYVKTKEYAEALAFEPDIVVIHLGINDTDPRDWPDFNSDFGGDYSRLIRSFREVNPQARIFIANLTPLTPYHYRWRSGTRLWRQKVRDAIGSVAGATGATLIDFETPLLNRQDLIHDAIHPNAEGALLLAETALSAITGDYGGLSLPEVYQSGMVVQRDRYLPIEGRANAGEDVTLQIDGRSYRTKADAQGRWRIVVAPLVAGGGYEMTVESGGKTLRLTDILAGEVWVASGQSNMEFKFGSDSEGAEAIAQPADTLLRFFSMRPRALTYDVVWDDSVTAAVDRLDYMMPTRWETVSPANAGQLSAVAVYYSRMLRDSLQVPVGVIVNAVGGAPAESYVDITTLQEHMPEILVDWRHNDYLQKWCQERAMKNAGTTHRHPYEPSYLFSATVAPLGHFPVKGVIWYQGESNAHNTDLHAQIFPLLVDSWRQWAGDAAMPFYFAQLSSLNRPSWPEFRDSQRRLAGEIDGVAMAVTSDHGDSLDVHPRCKRPVGERLARQALHRTYGFDRVAPQGPTPRRAFTDAGVVVVEVDYGEDMSTSDGRAPATFEVAEADGFFVDASARLEKGKIIITPSMDMKKPRFVRYGWQPFTRGNVTGDAGLPMSTFKIELDRSTGFEPEKGLDAGLSGSFAGLLPGGEIIVAGGCNFPVDPLGPTSKKQFYQGIYRIAAEADCSWERIGSLPSPMAYGASAATEDGLVLIGGTSATEATPSVWLLTTGRSGVAELKALASLPAPIDNAYAAAIGRKVYVAGGNVDGKPSAGLYMLDLADEGAGWKKLRTMPGNPRVQPVMAAAPDARGEICLWVWGGFAPRHDGHEPTLELDGLCYRPSTDRWTKTGALTDRDGEPVSVGGGAACTLTDGRVAVVGGVNKDVFIEALRNQAPDYLQHPASWYRFNGSLIVFDPRTGQSRVLTESTDLARAGASAVGLEDNRVLVTGGELKPRIRTSQIVISDCNE